MGLWLLNADAKPPIRRQREPGCVYSYSPWIYVPWLHSWVLSWTQDLRMAVAALKLSDTAKLSSASSLPCHCSLHVMLALLQQTMPCSSSVSLLGLKMSCTWYKDHLFLLKHSYQLVVANYQLTVPGIRHLACTKPVRFSFLWVWTGTQEIW